MGLAVSLARGCPVALSRPRSGPSQGSADRDKVRPRRLFSGGWTGWLKDPAAIAKVTEAQNLLIELGLVLVEMRMSQP